jgi:ABC-type polysaccharide/polyol phosphate export permease
MQQQFRELKERKFIKKGYLQNIFSSAQSCKQQFENVRLGFFWVLLDYIYTPCCVSRDEKGKTKAEMTGQDAK